MKRLFPRFKEVPISVKLWLLIVLNSSLALLLAGAGLLVYQRYEQRRQAARELSAQASVLAESVSAPISFDDPKAAREALAALHGDSQITEAGVYDLHGASFAWYVRDSPSSVRPTPSRRDGVYFVGNDLLTFQPVQLQGERVGTIFLRATTDANTQMRRYLAIVLVVLFLSLVVALRLSSGMHRVIATPIKELSRAARRVTAERDYSTRAVVQSGAEIGILVDSFNQMLAQIENQDRARMIAEGLLRESEQRYALAAKGANDGLWDWKLSTDEIYFSTRWAEMVGHSAEEIKPSPKEWFDRIHPSDRVRVKAEVATHLAGSAMEFASEYRMRHRNGSYIWMLCRGAVVRDEYGTAIRMAGSQTDVTQGKIADPLTGLPNRLYFLDRLEDAIQKGPAPDFAVLFIDLDRFKLINDSLGHAAGDELLMGVAGRLKSGVRGGAVGTDVGRRSVVARLGGDEFAVLLESIGAISEAIKVADRIVQSLKTPFPIAGRQIFGMVSIGIAAGSSSLMPEDLLRNADTAMYYAKGKGKGRSAVYDETMRDRAKARLEIETDLRKAIDHHQFVLYYQPQISLTSSVVVGYEALVRWQHPTRGLVPPSEFIAVAEETNLVVPLGRLVLQEACAQMAEWHRTICDEPRPSVSVNVSFRQLSDSNLVEDVRTALRDSGLDPKSLRLELTESSVMSNTELAIETLTNLRALGVALEIDDFGTGYSSLSYLNRLRFDTVKIDQSFVKDLHQSGESADLIRTILDLARSMNMSVVAEGVETLEQVEVLTALGCDYGQGYYFSRPADQESTQSLLRERYALRRAFTRLEGAPGSVNGLVAMPEYQTPEYQTSAG